MLCLSKQFYARDIDHVMNVKVHHHVYTSPSLVHILSRMISVYMKNKQQLRICVRQHNFLKLKSVVFFIVHRRIL